MQEEEEKGLQGKSCPDFARVKGLNQRQMVQIDHISEDSKENALDNTIPIIYYGEANQSNNAAMLKKSLVSNAQEAHSKGLTPTKSRGKLHFHCYC